MPATTDERTEVKNNLHFYVYDDLTGRDVSVYKFDNLKAAIDQYNILPDTWMTAIGVSLDDKHMVDLIQRRRERNVLVMDYEKLDVFSSNEQVKAAVSDLKKELSIQYQLIQGIHPRCSVIASMEQADHFDPYLKNKVLHIPKKSRSTALFASINELYVEGRGWLEPRDFLRTYADDTFINTQTPIVRRINANYKEIDTGFVGQCDMSPQEYSMLLKKTKEYALSFVDKKPAIEPPEKSLKKEGLDKTITDLKNQLSDKQKPLHKDYTRAR